MAVDSDLLLVLKSDGIGDGEPDLGEKLMGSFLNVLLESGNLPARVICINSGVFLTTENSPVVDTLRKFEEAGTTIVSCGTCLDYYDRADRLIIGKPTNMQETVSALKSFGRVIQP